MGQSNPQGDEIEIVWTARDSQGDVMSTTVQREDGLIFFDSWRITGTVKRVRCETTGTDYPADAVIPSHSDTLTVRREFTAWL